MNHEFESVPVITLEQAIADGWTGMSLRAVANSLERIARSGRGGGDAGKTEFEWSDYRGNTRTTLLELQNFDYRTNMTRARELRSIAKALDNRVL